ncbi:hypothetical protein [Pararhizobium sp. IMCC21322]|uniref:hypothetical protein n=1 Tax=Pararhizobium sp. IMCC21322 TaxID=3067903 RepID=UPI0027413DF7|nr:hypothetical protein [Pararhizobium sp. IMCC21322]
MKLTKNLVNRDTLSPGFFQAWCVETVGFQYRMVQPARSLPVACPQPACSRIVMQKELQSLAGILACAIEAAKTDEAKPITL